MKEEAFRFGAGNLGLGMVTLPADISTAPVVVALNAGLTAREGPHRLNTLACRGLAQAGYIAIRLDLAGKGDTPAREGLSNRESVALDWQYIKQSIVQRYGERKLVLMGLCSGADNAIKIAANDADVHGLILFDPISPKDADFAKREVISKLTNVHKWINLPGTLVHRIRRRFAIEHDPYAVMASLRDEPTVEDMDACFRHIAACQGKVLAVFTSQAVPHYNEQGQFVRAIDIPGLAPCCEEVYWPLVLHIYPVQIHRDRLLEKVVNWGKANLARLQRAETL